MRAIWVIVGVLALPAHAAAATVDAGALRGQVDDATGALRFTSASTGGLVLGEAGGVRLGVHTPAGWDRATKATAVRRAGTAVEADLVTAGGRTIRLRVAPGGDGVVAVTATTDAAGVDATGIGFGARTGERYLGFGERSNAVDQRGRDVEVFVGEGPYQPEERPFVAGLVPLWGYHPRDDATYFPVPWLLSTSGYGFLLDNAETSTFRLGERETWSVEAPSAQLGFRVFAGPRPADALARFTAATGRQPRVAAPWILGAWWQPEPGKGAAADQLANQRRLGVPVSVVETFLHYLPCADHLKDRDAVRKTTAAVHGQSAAVLAYFNPMVCTSHPAYGQGTYNTDATGQPYRYRYSTADQFVVSQVDFTSAAGRAFYGRLLKEAVDDGFDGWMEDFGEYTPPDARSSDGTPGAAMHNLYPTLYHRAATELTADAGRPIASYVRSGFTGTAKYARIVWGGDPTTDWGFDGLQSAVRNGLTMGLSGVSTWGSDIGGFFSLGTRALTPELLQRWIEFGAVSGVMRSKSKGIALPEKSRPQTTDPDILPVWRRWARFRTRLLPYLEGADDAYQRTGLPIMRSLALEWPRDDRLAGVEDAFLFGPDLLAAPVIRPGERVRRIEVPPGAWIDVWRSASADLDLRRARLVGGGRPVTVPAPADELPLLARAGTVLALVPRDVDTLTNLESPGVTRLADRRDRMDLRIWPRGWSSAFLADGERAVSSEKRGRRWVLRVEGARLRRYDVQVALGTLRRPFRPCRLRVGNRDVPRRSWSYHDGVLRFVIRGTRLRAEARRRC